MAKSNRNTVLERVKEVLGLLINGHGRDSIVHYCSKKWGIGERQGDNYISQAKEKIEASIDRNINYEFAKAVRRYEELFMSAMQKENFKLAVSINKELCMLQGLVKHGLEANAEDDIYFYRKMSDEQLQAELDKYKGNGK